jgi:hypothetical protein
MQLPSEEKAAFPPLYVTVNSDWLLALPQTGERLYFSGKVPNPDTTVLAFSPLKGFFWEQAQSPLWRVESPELVPELENLRGEAAQQLGLPRDDIEIYTYHPPMLESALQALVLRRIEESGLHPSEVASATVSFHVTQDGFIIELESLKLSTART